MDQIQLILIFAASIIGVVSAAYLYETVDTFMPGLKKPLRTMAIGMFVIVLGIILGAFISYESSLGAEFALYGVPLPAYFYIFYIIGFAIISFGARGLVSRPSRGVADVSLKKVS
ncbi:MAG: hypothetical protein KGI49_02710 [Patescibacteria group bacterium]|nr:hypothetical protein [Patescibacteria group bacterium]